MHADMVVNKLGVLYLDLHSKEGQEGERKREREPLDLAWASKYPALPSGLPLKRPYLPQLIQTS